MNSNAVSAPAVSAIVPTHQRREQVKRAVASVLSQTFRDFELIVVDDGSTDGTGEALEGLDDRVRYLWQQNRGPAAARNAALRLARGSVVAFLDSDNRWLPDHLSVLTETMARHPEAVLVSTCPMFRVGGEESPDDAELSDLREVVAAYGARAGYISCVAARRSAVIALGGFDERIRAGEDTDLYLRLGTLGPIATVRRRTVVRRASAGSLNEQARRSGDYLAAAELSATNLVAAAERRPEPERAILLDQARGAAHLARAMRALECSDRETLRTELELADRLLPSAPLSPGSFIDRLRGHLPRVHEPHVRLRALTMAAEVWPDPRADTARFMRVLAIATALRVGRPGEAARLAVAWPRGGTPHFLWHRAPQLHRLVRSWRSWTPITAGRRITPRS